jgi:predicted phosphodiesterase
MINMKLLVTSDIHVDKEKSASPTSLCNQIQDYVAQNPSEEIIFAILGDVSQNLLTLHNFLATFSSLEIPKLYVAGNHDIWSQKSLIDSPYKSLDSLEIYTSVLPEICKKTGFHYLDQEPFVTNRVGIIGNIGWYDFSFFSPVEPHVSKSLTFVRRSSNQQFLWSEMRYEDLASKQLWANDEHHNPIRICAWNDLFYIKWPKSMDDIDFCHMCYSTINQQFQEIDSSIDHLLFLSHYVLFENCICRYSSYEKEFYNAYRGCKFLGDFVVMHPKLRKVLCGHTHHPGIFKISKNIEAINLFYETNTPFKTVSMNF